MNKVNIASEIIASNQKNDLMCLFSETIYNCIGCIYDTRSLIFNT